MSAPTQRPFGEAWIADYFQEVDRMVPADLMRWYAEDAVFRFAAQPRVSGKYEIAKVLRAFYTSIHSMHHERTGVWFNEQDASGVWEAEVTFVTLDDREVVLPAVSVLRTRGGLVHDFRFVMDAAALFASEKP